VKIKKGDTVKVLSGKDRGRTGKVIHVLRKEDKVIVDKINIVKKHKKQTGDNKDQAGIIKIEAPIPVSKVMLICSECGKPTRVKIERKKKKVKRICKKCNKSI